MSHQARHDHHDFNSSSNRFVTETKLKFALFTALTVAVIGSAACAAPAPSEPIATSQTPPVGSGPFPNTKWIHTFWAKKAEPKREYFLGQLDTLGYTDGSKQATAGIYSIWGKVKFDAPQPSAQGPYSVDIYNIKLTCQTAEISTLREIKLAEDGTIVSDVSVSTPAKKVNARAPHLADLPYDEALAIDAMDYTCGGDSD